MTPHPLPQANTFSPFMPRQAGLCAVQTPVCGKRRPDVTFLPLSPLRPSPGLAALPCPAQILYSLFFF